MSEAQTTDAFHAGEVRMHELVGVADGSQKRASMIRGFMPDPHRDFFAQLPFVVVSGLDDEAQPWATVWTGAPGFMQSPEPTRLHVQPDILPGDPLGRILGGRWQAGQAIGLLGIEPHTRRRNRMNGRLLTPGPAVWLIEVRQSFGNCPKYIHPRLTTHAPRTEGPPEPQTFVLGPELDDESLAQIRRADTLFIASSSADVSRQIQGPGSGLDVSHRGGPTGFVHITQREPGERTVWRLTMPDYVGNMMFNTLGNILVHPRIGLFFMDLDRGDVLWLACEAQVDLGEVDPVRFPGAQRLVHMDVLHGRRSTACLPLQANPSP